MKYKIIIFLTLCISVLIIVFLSTSSHYDIYTIKGLTADSDAIIYNSISQNNSEITSDSISQKNDLLNQQLTLKTVAKIVGIDKKRENGLTGKGITVAVIDSGIYPHQDFTTPINRIIGFKDFINNYEETYDDNGHGTEIAGIIAGNGSYNSDNTGIAPDANLVSIKVLNKKNETNIDTLVKGIDWAVDNRIKYHIKIINLSLGVSANNEAEENKLSNSINRAFDSGILIITSVGNSYNNNFVKYFPASSNKVIAVGAIAETSYQSNFNYKIAKYSDYWVDDDKVTTKPDLVAPGTSIVSTKSDSYYKPDVYSSESKVNSYSSSTGTSEASAVVTGIAAILMQEHPHYPANEIRDLLLQNCVKLNSAESSQGRGLIYLS